MFYKDCIELGNKQFIIISAGIKSVYELIFQQWIESLGFRYTPTRFRVYRLIQENDCVCPAAFPSLLNGATLYSLISPFSYIRVFKDTPHGYSV